MDSSKVIDYYNNFVEEQKNTGINDRIFGLYRRLIGLGLNKASTVLELGCGVGAMTYLLAKTVTRGHIEAVDISPRSIAYCQHRIKKQNVRFCVGDVVRFAPSLSKLDFITLFDVIEHIPLEKHPELFQNLSQQCDKSTRIVINIPNPDYIRYDREHHPEALQVIDQPVPLLFIVENLEASGLELIHFETYSIWAEDDYQFFVLRKKRAFQENLLQDRRSFIQKAIKKVERTLVKIRHKY